MAVWTIKVRRGTYDALVNDRQKMSVGEPCAVLSGDPSVPSGKAFYICFEAGDVRRMVSVEDLEIMASRGDFKGDKGDDGRGIMDVEIDAHGRLIVTLTDGARVDAGYVLDILERIDASEQQRIQAEKDRVSAEQGRASAEASRRTAETGRETAEQARTSNEAARISDEAVRASNEDARVSNETAREQAEQARETAASAREKLWTEALVPAVEQAIRDTDTAADEADAVVEDLIARRDSGEFRGEPFTYEDFTAEQLAALKGEPGSRGVGIVSVERTSGNGAAGSTDIYTITLTDGSTPTFSVYNGADGQGAGDMLRAVYDTKGKNQDIFGYVDDGLDGKADLQDGKVPSSQLPSLDYVPTSEKGNAGGVAALGEDGKVPSDQLPSLDYIPADEKGQAEGVATLGDDGKVPSGQLPSLDYIPTDDRGAAGGVASLDAAGKIPDSQIPDLSYEPSGSVEAHDTSTTAHEDIRDVLAGKGDALTFDPASNKLCLKSGEDVVSETEIDTGAGDEVIQSWGTGNTVSQGNSIAAGKNNTNEGAGCAVFGEGNQMDTQAASGIAVGFNNAVKGCSYSAAFGMRNMIGKARSLATGACNASYAMDVLLAGSGCQAQRDSSAALGVATCVKSKGGTVCGRLNAVREDCSNYGSSTGDAFVVGNGSTSKTFVPFLDPSKDVMTAVIALENFRDDAVLSNAFRVSYSGDAYMLRAAQSSGADYAEFIKPWADDNPDNEDRVGYFVTVRDGLLHKANAGDYIAGITSGNPSVVGNADEDYYWRYERDVFGRIVSEEVPEYVVVLDDEGIPMSDENGAPVMEATGSTVKRMKLSADYDKTLQETYVERKMRPEWDYVGMLGVLPVRDDGTCVPGQYCKCADGGVATLAAERGFDTYMVIERVSDDVIKVILR